VRCDPAQGRPEETPPQDRGCPQVREQVPPPCVDSHWIRYRAPGRNGASCAARAPLRSRPVSGYATVRKYKENRVEHRERAVPVPAAPPLPRAARKRWDSEFPPPASRTLHAQPQCRSTHLALRDPAALVLRTSPAKAHASARRHPAAAPSFPGWFRKRKRLQL